MYTHSLISLFSVFEDVRVNRQCLLVSVHPAQQQSTLLEQLCTQQMNKYTLQTNQKKSTNIHTTAYNNNNLKKASSWPTKDENLTSDIIKPLLLTKDKIKPLLLITDMMKPLLLKTSKIKLLLLITDIIKPLILTTHERKVKEQ